MQGRHGRGGSGWAIGLILGVACAAAPVAGGRAAAQDFSGTGPAATRAIALPEGLVGFQVQHEGSGHYRFQLVDENGRLVQDLLDGSGVVQGSGELRVPRPGQYRIAVSGSGPWAIHLHPPAAGTASPAAGAQLPAPESTADTAAVPAGEQGRRDGVAAGRAASPWSWSWFGAGLAGGVVAGPVGAAVATVVAGHGPVHVPGDSALLGARGPDYGAGWRTGFLSGAIGARRESALAGGLVGTLVFGWAVLRLTHLGSQGGTSGTVGNPTPNAIVIGVHF